MPVIGTQQSPIEINPPSSFRIDVASQYLYPHYSGRELKGHFDLLSKNFVFEEYESFRVESQDWVIRKIHVHDPAEHRFAGRARAAFEVHILHTMGTAPCDDPEAIGPKLVLATLFHPDAAAESRTSASRLNAKLKAAIQPGKADRAAEKLVDAINPLEFLPGRDEWNSWFRYEGSLTSEPYSEDVSWYVFDREVGILEDEVSDLSGSAKQEARPVYALDRRYVLRSFE